MGGRRCGSHPWVGKIPWRRKWQPLQDSCLENYMDRGAWWTIVHVVETAGHNLSTRIHAYANACTSSVDKTLPSITDFKIPQDFPSECSLPTSNNSLDNISPKSQNIASENTSGGEGHGCVGNVLQSGFACCICWLGTTLVVSPHTMWMLNVTCHFLLHGSAEAELPAWGQRKVVLAAETLVACSTCQTYNFSGEMRVSIFSPRFLYALNSGWVIFVQAPLCLLHTQEKGCFLYRIIATKLKGKKRN